MEYIIIVCFLVMILFILAKIYDISIIKFKKFIKEEEERLNNLTEKYPSNVEICKYILKKLHNDKVKIEEDKEKNTCLYVAVSDKIIIANLKNSYTRIQTICHECLHSIQSKKILIFNFLYSNFYLIYFIIVTMLGIMKRIQNKNLILSLMIIFSYQYYFIRSYLENDAMTKARFLAKEYMEEINLSNEEEINLIIDGYDRLNDKGIKMTNLYLFFETVARIIVVALVFAI